MPQDASPSPGLPVVTCQRLSQPPTLLAVRYSLAGGIPESLSTQSIPLCQVSSHSVIPMVVYRLNLSPSARLPSLTGYGPSPINLNRETSRITCILPLAAWKLLVPPSPNPNRSPPNLAHLVVPSCRQYPLSFVQSQSANPTLQTVASI